MTTCFTLFAPQSAQPIQTVYCTAGILTKRVAAPLLFAGECKEKSK
jgi:hypothetical protein